MQNFRFPEEKTKNKVPQWTADNLKMLLRYFMLAVVVNLVVELCNRRGLIQLAKYLVTKPLPFLYGVIIVYLTFSMALLFRKRNYFVLLLCIVWIGLAVISFVMLSGFVSTPLTAPDIAILRSARDIIQVYLGNFAVTMILFGVSLLLGALLFLFLRFRSYDTPYGVVFVNLVLAVAVTVTFSHTLKNAGLLDEQFTNIPTAYQNNGFVYCFTCSALYQGIDAPQDYNDEVIEQLVAQADTVMKEPTKKPNIVYVQLESFFDVKKMQNLTFSEDPLPNFTRLKEEYSSGLFSVPSIGAGTVNTEFEVLSQMNLQFFGVGEYPYKTVIRDRVCENIAYDLKEIGYATHAIHNNNASFYQRNLVYANFGFDTFTSVEYMNNVELNPLGWAKDTCLTREILKVLDSTEGQDFVFAVSVQPHGQYPSAVIDENQSVSILSGMEEDPRRVGFEYYINQVKETDAFVGQLVNALSNYPEDVILVFYGDHQPGLYITNEELSDGNVQTTEYIIWSNFDLPKEDKDIRAYQLTSTLMDKIGITSGILTRFHMLHKDDEPDDPVYEADLKALCYDMLYGDFNCYGGEMPFEPTDLQLGTTPIRVTGGYYDIATQTLYVRGGVFTPYSRVWVNGELLETEFNSPNLLRVVGVELKGDEEVAVAQTSKTDHSRILSQTDSLFYSNTKRTLGVAYEDHSLNIGR